MRGEVGNCECVPVPMCVHPHMCSHVCTCISMCVHRCPCMCVCVCVCVSRGRDR